MQENRHSWHPLRGQTMQLAVLFLEKTQAEKKERVAFKIFCLQILWLFGLF